MWKEEERNEVMNEGGETEPNADHHNGDTDHLDADLDTELLLHCERGIFFHT